MEAMKGQKASAEWQFSLRVCEFSFTYRQRFSLHAKSLDEKTPKKKPKNRKK
jgi:hypothetical protein